MQCGAENAEYQVQMLAIEWPSCAAVIQILVSCTSHQAFSSGAKWLICSHCLALQVNTV
jgi:hypothetical protein